MAKAKLESLKVGTRFKYGSKSAVVLDKMDDGVLCIVVGENYRAVFDKESSSNFAKSTLYHELHTAYLGQWLNEGADLHDFVEMKVDLKTNDGTGGYGICEVLFAPMTSIQYEKYKELIPSADDWEWTVTPSNSHRVQYIKSDGSLGNGNAYCSYNVRPLFKLKSDTEVEIGEVPENMTLEDAVQKLIDEYGVKEVLRVVSQINIW